MGESAEVSPPDDLLEAAVSVALREPMRLAELEDWLLSRRQVVSVRLEDYLVKTFPPRRDFSIVYKLENGRTTGAVLSVVVDPDNVCEFYEFRPSDVAQ